MSLKCDGIWDSILLALKNVDPSKRTLVAIFQFNMKQNGEVVKVMTLDFKELKVTEGPCLNPDAVLTIEDDLLLSCAKREISIMECINLKKAEGSGNLELFEKLNEKFPQK
uniref:CSON012479 protein n=1 Tax=Culicoides sonorensis TaxID=179676 RepID=A0A336N520_CULSO